MMKRFISIAVILASLLCISIVGYAEDVPVQVVIDGQVLEIEPGAMLIQGSTYVPLKPFVQSFAYEAEVVENNLISVNEYIIDCKKTGRVIKLHISQGTINEVVINGIVRKTNAKAIYQKDQLWVPIVFLVRYLGGQVTWSASTRRVIVESYKPIEIKDANLNEVIRSSIGISKGDILQCDVELLNVLVIPNKKIADLEGIQYLTNLVHLDLSNNLIKDVTPLRQLTKLDTLYLKGNQITDYSPLAAIYNQLNLRDFNIVIGIYDKKLEAAIREKIGKPIGTLTLEDMQKVTELDLTDAGISELQGIQFLTNLKKLNLTGNNIKHIGYLKNLILLEELALNHNNVEDIQALKYLSNLEQLDLYQNQISDLTPLADLVKLKQLSVMENKVTDISSLKNLMNLEILVLQNNEISDISVLGNLVNLKELYLGKNKINDISILENLVNIEILNLKNNEISDVSSLNNLINLKELYIAENLVEDYSVLSDLKKSLQKTDIEINYNGPMPKVDLKFYIDKPVYYKNDSKMSMDVAPIIKEGRTFLPVKYVGEGLEAQVGWNASERKVTVILGNDRLEMVIGKNKALFNGDERLIDVAPFIENGRTMVPLRFLSESFGCEVDWDPDLRCVTLYSRAYDLDDLLLGE